MVWQGSDRRRLPLRMSNCVDCERDDLAARQLAAKMQHVALVGIAKGPDIAARRLACKVCPHAKTAHTDLPSWANFSTCQLCHCNIADKTKRAASFCPDSPPRWLA